MAYQGEGAYGALKTIAILNIIGAIIIAIMLWANASGPHLVFEAGGTRISEEADPATIAAGVLVLGEGIVVGLLLWAVGTIGEHVVAMRREVAPIVERVLAPAGSLGTGAVQTAQPARRAGYDIIIEDLGGADPAWIAKGVREYTDLDAATNVIVPGNVLVAGQGYATAEPLRAALARKGVSVEMRERSSS